MAEKRINKITTNKNSTPECAVKKNKELNTLLCDHSFQE